MVSVQSRTLSIIINRAMKLISSRLDRGRNDRACRTPDLCGGNTGRNLEFSDGIRVRESSNCAKLRLVVVHAVKREIVIRRALTVGRNRRAARPVESRGFRTSILVAGAWAAASRPR